MKRNVAVTGAVLGSVLLAVPILLAGSALAQPTDAPGTSDASHLTLPWNAMGLKSDVFLSPGNPEKLTVPIPVGLSPTRLRGVVRAPLNFDAGTVEVDDVDGKFITAIDLPPGASGRPPIPFEVDVSAAARNAVSLGLTFSVRPRFDPQNYTNAYCWPRQQVVLGDLSTVYSGSEAPTTTIAGFFPSVLQQATIYTPTDADADEQQAVLTLVSTLARMYSDQPTVINVVNQPRGATPPPAGGLTRVVLVERNDDAGLKVDNPGTAGAFLRVSGRGADLSKQLSPLVDQLQGLAQAPTIRVDQAGSSDPAPLDNTMTFRRLNLAGRADFIHSGSLALGVGRTSLGPGRVDEVKFRLLAHYTPVAKDESATVLIRSGGVVVYQAALDETGLLDATFEADRQKIGQFVDLDVALTYNPRQACGLLIPMTFEVDPQSTINVHRGGPPLNGFGAVPSEFSPKFMVAMDGTGPNQLDQAARLVASIARSATAAVTPQVVDLKTASGAGTGALIIANSDSLKATAIKPPISSAGTAVTVELPTALRANLGGGLGSIQAIADSAHNRSIILVTTTGPWSLVDPVFGYLQQRGGDLSKLTGDVLVAGAAGDTMNIAVQAAGSAGGDGPSQPFNGWTGIGVGAAVVAVLAGLGAVLWRRKRRTT